MLKTLITVLAIVALALTGAGCGGSSSSSTPPNDDGGNNDGGNNDGGNNDGGNNGGGSGPLAGIDLSPLNKTYSQLHTMWESATVVLPPAGLTLAVDTISVALGGVPNYVGYDVTNTNAFVDPRTLTATDHGIRFGEGIIKTFRTNLLNIDEDREISYHDYTGPNGTITVVREETNSEGVEYLYAYADTGGESVLWLWRVEMFGGVIMVLQPISPAAPQVGSVYRFSLGVGSDGRVGRHYYFEDNDDIHSPDDLLPQSVSAFNYLVEIVPIAKSDINGASDLVGVLTHGGMTVGRLEGVSLFPTAAPSTGEARTTFFIPDPSEWDSDAWKDITPVLFNISNRDDRDFDKLSAPYRWSHPDEGETNIMIFSRNDGLGHVATIVAATGAETRGGFNAPHIVAWEAPPESIQ